MTWPNAAEQGVQVRSREIAKAPAYAVWHGGGAARVPPPGARHPHRAAAAIAAAAHGALALLALQGGGQGMAWRVKTKRGAQPGRSTAVGVQKPPRQCECEASGAGGAAHWRYARKARQVQRHWDTNGRPGKLAVVGQGGAAGVGGRAPKRLRTQTQNSVVRGAAAAPHHVAQHSHGNSRLKTAQHSVFISVWGGDLAPDCGRPSIPACG